MYHKGCNLSYNSKFDTPLPDCSTFHTDFNNRSRSFKIGWGIKTNLGGIVAEAVLK